MSFIGVGCAVPPLGFVRRTSAVPGGPEGFEVRKRYYSVDPLQLRSTQPAQIKVDLNHGHLIVGDVQHLEVAHNGGLWAVAEMHGPCPEQTTPQLFWSVSSNSKRNGADVVIDRIAITDDPGMIGAKPIQFVDCELREHPVGSAHGIDPFVRDVLLRAAAAKTRRRTGGPIRVVDVDTKRADMRYDREANELHLRGRPGGPIRYGPPGRVLAVNGRPVRH